MESQNLIKAVLFDLDGVLADSEPVHAKSWDLVLQDLGFHFSEDWFIQWIGIDDRTLAGHLKSEHHIALDLEELLERKRQSYRNLAKTELKPFPGVPERLDRLAHIPLAVVTSSMRPDANLAIEAPPLAGRFSATITAEDVKEHKPAPAPYLKAAQTLNAAPGQCAAVEDSPAGVRSARAAGCIVLAVTTYHTAEALSGADHYFSATTGALDWLVETIK